MLPDTLHNTDDPNRMTRMIAENAARRRARFDPDLDDMRLPDDDFDIVRLPFDDDAGVRPVTRMDGSGESALVEIPASAPDGVGGDCAMAGNDLRGAFLPLPMEVLLGNPSFFNELQSSPGSMASNPYWIGRPTDLFRHFGMWVTVIGALQSWDAWKLAMLLDEYFEGGVWALAAAALSIFALLDVSLWFRYRNNPVDKFMVPGGVLLMLFFVLALILHFQRAAMIAW